MDEVKVLLQRTFQTENKITFPLSGPGSAGMEACIVNLVERGDKVVVCENGVFGKRMTENVVRCGGTAIVVEDPWGSPVSLSKVAETLERHRPKFLAFVHAETSTGAMSDAQGLSAIAQAHGCLTIVDTVTSLAGIPVKVDEWQLDAVYSGSQKCLSCPPGLSPVTMSERALHHIKNRKTPVQSWFMDVNLLLGYWQGTTKRAYHHTAPINAIYGLHEALLILHEEGLENAFTRHRATQKYLVERLKPFEMAFLVDEFAQLPQLNAIKVPSTVANEESIRTELLNRFQIEIGAGLGPLAGKIWRIGLMGNGATRSNVDKVVDALGALLK
jgi:alanine-glyoxylate transaminase/serine-glyoxylate transaminase/serine-pyruvate transaminase